MKYNIGEKLKNIRKIHGKTLTAQAKILKITPAGLSQIENGKRNPSYGTLTKFIRILKIDPRYLYDQ